MNPLSSPLWSQGCLCCAAPDALMLYMVLETFRGGDAVPVYRRVRDGGRGMPDGLR